MTRLDYIKYLIPIILALVLLVTCNKNSARPGLEYMPDMVHSKAYETYADVKDNPAFPTGQTALLPPKGSIPINSEGVYDLPNTPEAYEVAALRTQNPIPTTEESLARGKEIYTIHCTPCHGDSGDGQGSAVVGSEMRLPPPPISFVNPQAGYLTAGRMFHTITHGRNSMGSYASQVSPTDRWKVIQYIYTLNENYQGDEPAAEETDTTAVETAATMNVEGAGSEITEETEQ